MTTRLDLAIQKNPDREADIRLFADRDPSGNLKYLHWQVKVLLSGQALAPEIADVVELFHKFSGRGRLQPRRSNHVRSDIYSYRPQDLAGLRDKLLKRKRAQDKKQRSRDRLYRIEGQVEATVVFESDTLVVRHVQNKAASMHYGLGTKWCTAMKRESYFDDYESQNAVLFYCERRVPKGDEFDKAAVMVSRDTDSVLQEASTWSATDERLDLFALVRAYGPQAFDAMRLIYERAVAYPGSGITRLLAGKATAEELDQAVRTLTEPAARRPPEHALLYPVERLVEAVCCNDAAPWPMLQGIVEQAATLVATERKNLRRSYRGRRRVRFSRRDPVPGLIRTVLAAVYVHPSTPPAERAKIGKKLTQRHVRLDSVRIDRSRDGVSVVYAMRGQAELGRRYVRVRYGHYRRRQSLSYQANLVGILERELARVKRRVKKLRAIDRAKKTKKAKKKKGPG